MHKYDFAYLYLSENNYVNDDQILEQKWNVTANNTPIEVIGFSPVLDKQHG
jgi:uncharacterized protein affecting Mg2+/Co2+ transport